MPNPSYEQPRMMPMPEFYPITPPTQGGGRQTSPSQQGNGSPPAPPPQFIPQKTDTGGFAFYVDAGAIQPCINRYVYIWATNGEEFWFQPTFIGGNSAAGWRWYGNQWGYTGVDLNRISQFRCY